RWKVPVTAALEETQPATVPVDPYLLGILIGDGNFTQNCVRFSTADAEILDRVQLALGGDFELRPSLSRRYDYRIVMSSANTLKRRKRYARVRANALVGHVERLGLLGRPAHAKFIPEAYKRARIEQRYALLRGLLDSDGHVTSTGSISFSTSSFQLAIDVQE